MGRKVTESSLKNFRLVDVKSESSSSVHFHSMFMQTGVKNRKEQRGLARWPQKALPVLPELWVKRRRPSSSHMPCEGHGEKLRIQSQGAATVRAGGPHCRDVMSQPVLSPGGGCRWDSEDPRMEVELNQWWRDDGQAPNHAENKPCPDPRLHNKHSLLSVQQGTQKRASGSTQTVAACQPLS